MSTPVTARHTDLPILSWFKKLEITPTQLLYLEGALAAYLAIGSLTWPLGVDQSFFYATANTILEGGVLYRDTFEIKGPLTYYICAFVIAVFGNHEISIRIFDLLVLVLFCYWLKSAAVCEKSNFAIGGTFTITFFCITYISLGFWDTAQPDEWGGMLIAVAILLMLEPSSRPRRTMATAGFLISLAVLIKPTFLIFFPIPLLYGPSGGKGIVASLAPRGMYVFVSTITIALALAIVFRRGGWGEYLDIWRFLSSSYNQFSQRDLSDELRAIPHSLHSLGLAIPYAFVVPAMGFIRYAGSERRALVLSTWFILGAILVVIQGKYYPYQYIPCTIAAAVILGNCLSLITRTTAGAPVQSIAIGLATFVIGCSAVTADVSYYLFGTLEWPAYALGYIEKTDYMSDVAFGYPTKSDPVVSYIDKHSNEGDTIFVWSWNIRFLATGKRRAATRFGTFEALITKGSLQEKYRQIFMSDMNRRPPRYIVVDCLDSAYRPESSLWLLRDYGEFNRFLHEHYQLDTQIGQYEIWAKI